jgi:fermentation-respiration switch protein FrsA (DUF1100 family)
MNHIVLVTNHSQSIDYFMKTLFKNIVGFVLLAYVALVGIGVTYSDKLIFLPQPPSYSLSDQHIVINSKSADIENADHQIVALYLRNPESKYTILYSHGNATDLGGLQYLQKNFYKHGYSILIYDYSGYGQSEGVANEQQVYNDVQAIYDYLITDEKMKPEQIIAYGHSLGAAIATDLAYNNTVGALVLESPFTTAFRVKTVYSIVPFDKFASVDKIENIHAPVFIAHSKDDYIIPFWHGVELFDTANEPKKFLAFEKEGHTQITHNKSFWQTFEKFVSTL